MTFGQIEQSWFEDDLWSLYSMPPSPVRREVVEPTKHDQPSAASIATVAPLNADRIDSPIPSPKHPVPAESHQS